MSGMFTPLVGTTLAIGFLLGLSRGALAQHEHYVRDPFKIPGTGAVEELALGSDQELSVILFREGGAGGRVRAVVNDGRGLSANWSSADLVSNDTNAVRALDPTSCQVQGGRAFAAWLDDRDGAGQTRVHFNRYTNATDTWLAAPIEVNDSSYPVGADVQDFHMVAKRGTSGLTYVLVMVHLEAAGADYVFVTLSSDGGATFAAPINANSGGGSPGDVGGIGCDMRFGELHLAWTDASAGTMDLYYRLALTNLVGQVFFFGSERMLSTAVGSEAEGTPILEVNGEFGWSGTDQKYVGIAYRQDDGDGTTDLHLATSRDNGANFDDIVVARTAFPGVDVGSIDLELPGDTYVVTWEDDGEGTPQVFRGESADGSAITLVTQMSAQAVAEDTGSDPRISPSFGTPDGSMIVFVEDTPEGPEVVTAFGDQAFGGEWHEEYPAVSHAQQKGPEVDVKSPDVAYNARYYNFIVGWLQEGVAGSGDHELWVGGYRPHQVELDGWFQGSPSIQFTIEHTPFQDTFGFVLVSLQPPTPGTGTVLYDGRRTGVVFDSITNLLAGSHFPFFAFVNDSTLEGGITLPFSIPPFVSAPDLTYFALTWGPFGDLHAITEPFVAEFGAPRPAHSSPRQP